MKLLSLIYLLIATTTCSVSTTPKPLPVPEIFEGTTPCSNIIRSLHQIQEERDCALEECHCILVEWKLTLYRDASQQPTTYKLTSISRNAVKETNMYSDPGTKTESEGKWKIIRGSKTNPKAVFYRLNPDEPGVLVDLARLSDQLVHVLDREGRLMIGNEFFSYTLNRKVNK